MSIFFLNNADEKDTYRMEFISVFVHKKLFIFNLYLCTSAAIAGPQTTIILQSPTKLIRWLKNGKLDEKWTKTKSEVKTFILEMAV